MDENERLPDLQQEIPPVETPEEEKRPYATRGQRIAAWIAAIGVIIITISYIYSIYSGTLFSR